MIGTNEEAVLAFMREEAYRPLTEEELRSALGVPPSETEAFRRLLDGMEAAGAIVRTRKARYGVPERMNLLVGTFQGHEKGFGFVVPLEPDGGTDVYVAPKDMNGAMNGDRVVVRLTSRGTNGRRCEGEVIRILHRANPTVVGTLERRDGYGYVSPDDRKLAFNIFVPGPGLADARDGEKVVVAITVWPDSRRGPEGRVLQRLGLAGEPGVDILSVLYKYGLPTEFPEDVLAEAEGIPGTVTETEVRGRWDFRSLPVVTIDSETARDLDDAVSLEPPPEGVRWRLGVHIADVSHYVREGSALDREARDRGTSVYLVDRVIPMLPPRLSNGICSLNPGADRLTVSVVMDFDALGRRLRYRVGPSVIRSRARLTYTAVGRLLEGASPAEAGVPEEVAPMLRDLGELAVALHRRRQARGSIDFDLPEPEVFLDSQGRPFDIRRSEHGAAHRLIEECMLAANEAVAELCFVRELPCLYRVHEKPAQEKVEALEALLFALGIPFRRAKELRPKDFQRVLTQVEGRAEARLIHAVMLRSMQQARYRAENLGHFGLAARFYCHFTSPIRRYPDLVVHRSVRSYLESGRPTVADAGRLADVADHCSRRERLAADAEWDTVRLKMLEYMEDKVGQVFPGIIAGVASYGFYVQLENLVEGLVHVSTLTDDYYVFDEKRYALIGERTGRLFRLGDTVSVIIARVRRSEGLIDFTLAEEETTRPARRRRAGRSGKARKTKA